MADSEEKMEYTARMQSPFREELDREEFERLMQSEAPIEIEIGSGKGLFLRNAASTNPKLQWIGLEIANKYARMCNEKLQVAGLSNGVCFCADGVFVMDAFVPKHRLNAVHVYFPDPWWKAKHKKRRVLNSRLLAASDRAIKPGGFFHFWTDVLDYYESTVELIAAETDWDGPYLIEERGAAHDLDYLTHFERRTRLNSLPVYRSYYVKRSE